MPKNNCLALAVIIAVFLVVGGELLYNAGLIAMPIAATYQGLNGDWTPAVMMAVVAVGILIAVKGGPVKPLGNLLVMAGGVLLVAVILQTRNELIGGAWLLAILGTLVSGFFALLLPWRR